MKQDVFVLQENEPGHISLRRNEELQMCPHANPMVACGSHCPMFAVEWATMFLQKEEEDIIGQIKTIPTKVHIGCSSVVIAISN